MLSLLVFFLYLVARGLPKRKLWMLSAWYFFYTFLIHFFFKYIADVSCIGGWKSYSTQWTPHIYRKSPTFSGCIIFTSVNVRTQRPQNVLVSTCIRCLDRYKPIYHRCMATTRTYLQVISRFLLFPLSYIVDNHYVTFYNINRAEILTLMIISEKIFWFLVLFVQPYAI